MSGRNSFPEDHRLFAGFLAADRARIVESLEGADFILVLGAPVFTYHVEGSGPHIPAGAELVQLVDDPSQAAWTPVGRSIVTHLKSGVRALLNGPPPVSRVAPPRRLRPAHLSGQPFTDAYLLQAMAALRPPDSVIVEEAPSSRGPMHDRLPILIKDGFYTCSSGGLGHGLPAAVGVALARPHAKVIAILGDGSSMYSIQSLWSAAQLGLKIVFVIVNNRRYEALHEFARHFRLDRLHGTRLPQLDFCGLAQAQGVAAIRVTRAQELAAVLEEAFEFTRSLLVEVVLEGADDRRPEDA